MIYRLFLPSIGGIQRHVFAISRELVERGHEVTVLTTNALSQGCNDEDIIQGIRVKRCPYYYPRLNTKQTKDELDHVGGNPASIEILRSLLSADYDMVHIHQNMYLTLTSLLATWIRRKAYFLTLHSEVANSMSNGSISSVIWRTNVLRAKACLCISRKEYLRTSLIRKSRCTYLFPNGVDLQEFKGASSDEAKKKHSLEAAGKIVLCVARILPPKGQDTLVRAVPNVLRVFRDAKFVFYGPVDDPNYYQHLVQLRNDLGLQQTVLFISHTNRKDLVDLFSACDLTVVPSHSESFPLVISESWAAKKPVIASRIENVQTIVEDNKGGILFSPCNSLSLADKIIQVLSDVNEARTLGMNGYNAVVQKYTWPRIVDELEQIYGRCLST